MIMTHSVWHLCYTAEGHYLYEDLDSSCGCSTGTLMSVPGWTFFVFIFIPSSKIIAILVISTFSFHVPQFNIYFDHSSLAYNSQHCGNIMYFWVPCCGTWWNEEVCWWAVLFDLCCFIAKNVYYIILYS